MTVASVTMDGHASNVSMCNQLGCRLKAYSPISSTTGQINWTYIVNLNDVQAKEGLHAANTITDKHVNFDSQKMKVSVAAQTLSRSVTEAQRTLRDLGYSQFQHCEATAEFIEFLEVSYWQCGIITPTVCHMYLSVVGFIINIDTLMMMIPELLQCQRYICTYRFSQDHLELLFNSIRASDATTLSRASKEYRTEIDMLLHDVSLHTEQDRENVTKDMMDKGRRILQENLETFVHTGLCPNKCGLLYQRVINCYTCASEIRTCPSPPDRSTCGERHLEAEEGSSAVLDCSFPWHNLVEGDKVYQFSRYSNPAGKFMVFSATSSSSVVLNNINLDEQGVYQCRLLDSKNKVLTSLKYRLTVKPSAPTTPVPTLPPDDSGSLPPELPKDLLAAFVAAVIVLGLAGCCGLAVAFGLALRRERREEIVMAEEGTLPD
ncbi:uncharacterized protein [Paramormyrops kingsleyae]|uniref:uncharacterized protein isoform X2 n=1 Tax=Paramormyrops kingsleyae TaxID=1676925 RepID=UPI003B97B34A